MDLTAGLVASPALHRDLDGCLPELFEAVRRRRARKRAPPASPPEAGGSLRSLPSEGT